MPDTKKTCVFYIPSCVCKYLLSICLPVKPIPSPAGNVWMFSDLAEVLR